MEHSPAHGVSLYVSVLNEDTSSWNRGEAMILRYSLDRNEHRVKIESNLGYLTSFNAGGPIAPLNYYSPTNCPFRWEFPILDFKVLNNRPDTLFLTEVVLDIEESRADPAPLLTIRQDAHRVHAGYLQLINEGWCDLTDLTISFRLLPEEVAAPPNVEPPYPHSITLPILTDRAEVDVTQAFQEEGVDIDELILLTNGELESQDTLVVPRADGSKERMTLAELDEREKKCLGKFQNWVGTLAGEISFTLAAGAGRKHRVKFHAPVYLANERRLGLPKPPTYMYDATFDIQNTAYQRRVQISHELKPGDTDRFTVKIAVAQSSSHRFRATVRDITGLALQSLPIEMKCFVPRSQERRVARAISPAAGQSLKIAGGDPARSFQSMDRATFVKTLCALSPSDFDSFVASIENAATHISRHGTVPEKAAELIRWAESSTGPGFATIQDAWTRLR